MAAGTTDHIQTLAELPNQGGNMESCCDCLMLEHRLSEASEHYVGLILQQARLIRDDNREASGLEAAVREARSRRTSMARDLLSHRRTHNHSHAKARAATPS